MTVEKLEEYAKALVALAGAVAIVAAALVEGLAEVQDAVTAVAAALTAFGVYAVPNRVEEDSD